eukprot:330905-Pyramimonas_sp.AAC.1
MEDRLLPATVKSSTKPPRLDASERAEIQNGSSLAVPQCSSTFLLRSPSPTFRANAPSDLVCTFEDAQGGRARWHL